MKVCSTCKQPKAEGEFHVRKASKDGLAASCKECINEKNREKYASDEEFRAGKIVQATSYKKARAA